MAGAAPVVDITRWREAFPALARRVHGQRLAFLDSAASAQKPQMVLDALQEVLGGAYANIHRGLYFNSADLTARYEAARARIAAFFKADPLGLVLTRGATESINLVAQALPFKDGDGIILSDLEHHANVVPWQLLQQRVGIRVHVVPLDENGALRTDAFNATLADAQKQGPVRLVALSQMSNVTGVCPPLAEIVPLAHAAGALVLVDGSQGAVHMPQDLHALDADFYAFTGHKIYGPTGVGGLWVKPALLETMQPWMGGGDMIEQVSWQGTTYASGVARFEAGTPPIAEVIGLAAAMDFMDGLGREAVVAYEAAMAVHLDTALDGVDGLVRYGAAGRGHGIASFNLTGCHPHDVATLLDQQGVAVRSGHHCAMPLHAMFGVPGTLRASLALYSDRDDIDQLVAGLHKARHMLA